MWLSALLEEGVLHPAFSGLFSGFQAGYFFRLAGTGGCLVAPSATSFCQAE